MSSAFRLLIRVFTLAAVHACAGSAPPATGGTATTAMTAAAVRKGSANVIVEGEIPASGAQNALEVIQRLRPAMLRGRTGSSTESGTIVIYVDNQRVNDPEALTAVPAVTVREIRFLNAGDATTRFGTGHAMGAILVSTKR